MLTLVNIIFAVFVILLVLSLGFMIRYSNDYRSKTSLFWNACWYTSLTGIEGCYAADYYFAKNFSGAQVCLLVTVMFFIWAVVYWFRYQSADSRQ
jgi:hypothetical protein